MDKVTKKYLLNLIESMQTNIDEMPSYNRKGTRTDKNAPGEFLPITAPNSDNPGEYGEIEGYYIPQINQVVMILDCLSKQEFIDKNKEWLDGLAEKWHNKYGTATDDFIKEIEYAPCKKTKTPRKQADLLRFLSNLGFEKKPTEGKKKDPSTLNKTVLGEILRENLFGPGVSDVFRKKTIPFNPMEKSTMKTLWQGLKGFGDQYSSEFSDQKISFNLFAGYVYKSQYEFLETIILNDSGEFGEASAKSEKYYVSRQWNKKYPNYDAAKPMIKDFKGLTPIQQKPKQDLREPNIDVTIRTDVSILGEFTNENSFTWKLLFKIVLGKKLEEDPRLKKGFDSLNNIMATQTVQLNPNDVKSPIMYNKNVQNGLRMVCDELREKVESVDFEKILEYANVEVSSGFDLQEMVRKIVKDLIK